MSGSLNALYRAVGVSKQSVHQYGLRQASFWQEVGLLEVLVKQVRRVHGGCGLEKLYYRLKPTAMGRDRFIAVFSGLGYGLKRGRNWPKTTIRGLLDFPNLIEGMVVLGPDQVWQSDISYYLLGDQYYYLIFIIDVYSKRILGYGAFDHMRSQANEVVLAQALALRGGGPLPGLIHHSDHGRQYMAKSYRQLLHQAGAQISMGEKAQENAFAERINGIIKGEYLGYQSLSNFSSLKRALKTAVEDYNQHRPHNHLKRMSPLAFEQAYQDRSLPQQLVTLIYAQNGPDFRKRAKQINPLTKIPFTHFCPLEINPLFYPKAVNPI